MAENPRFFCHRCGRTTRDNKRFALQSCFHLLCESCFVRGKCGICQLNPHKVCFIPDGHNLPDSVSHMFVDPNQLTAEHIQQQKKADDQKVTALEELTRKQQKEVDEAVSQLMREMHMKQRMQIIEFQLKVNNEDRIAAEKHNVKFKQAQQYESNCRKAQENFRLKRAVQGAKTPKTPKTPGTAMRQPLTSTAANVAANRAAPRQNQPPSVTPAVSVGSRAARQPLVTPVVTRPTAAYPQSAARNNFKTPGMAAQMMDSGMRAMPVSTAAAAGGNFSRYAMGTGGPKPTGYGMPRPP